MAPETSRHLFKAIVYAVPVFNVLVMALWTYGAIRSPRFRVGFVLIACASAFCAFPQSVLAIAQAQVDYGAEWFSKEMMRSILPAMTISYWAVMPFYILGALVVIRRATRADEQSENPNK